MLRFLGVIILFSLVCSTFALAQENPENASEKQPLPNKNLTPGEVFNAVKFVNESQDLTEEQKTQLLELLKQAEKELKRTEEQTEQSQSYRKWSETANKEIQTAKEQKKRPPSLYDLSNAEFLDLHELAKELNSLEQKLADSKKRLDSLQAEPQKRVKRKAEIPDQLASLREELAQVESKLSAPPPEDIDRLLLQARRYTFQARRQAIQSSLSLLEAEREAYDAQGELPMLKIDLATRDVNQLTDDINRLVNLITERRKLDANSQRQDAQKALDSAPEWLLPIVKANIKLAEKRIEIASELKRNAATSLRINQQLSLWQVDYERTSKWAETVINNSLGEKLSEKRAALPSTVELSRDLSKSSEQLSLIQQDIFKLKDRRSELSDLDAARDNTLRQLRNSHEKLPETASSQIYEQLALEVRILDSLDSEMDSNYSHLLKINESQSELLKLVNDYRVYIEQKIFWVRNSPALGIHDLINLPGALSFLLHSEHWKTIYQSILQKISRKPFKSSLFFASLVLLLLYAYRFRKEIRLLGETAAPISCHEIRPTLQVMVYTLFLSLPWAILALFFRWSLSDAPNEITAAFSDSLFVVLIGLFTIQSGRQVSRPGGLAECHFGWSRESLSIVRRVLNYMILLGTPLVFISVLFERLKEPTHQASLGRISLVLLLLLLAWTFWKFFSRRSPVMAEIQERSPTNFQRTLSRAWGPLLIVSPLLLAGLAIYGYQRTSFSLSVHLWRTFELIFLLWTVGALMFRWLRLKRRRIRFQQIMEARQKVADSEQNKQSELETITAKEEEIDLVVINQQSRKLISLFLVGIFVIGCFGIWYNVLPALNPIWEWQLWSTTGTDGSTTSVTLGATILAILVFGLSLLASRNIPGLIDVMLLDKLGIASSTRYAISTLTQYALMISGALYAFNAIGFTWDKAQWLIAALSVGLGFGLQEIVANFVCGILVLFERPIRVGDTVTLGDTTGIVVRIRSRATTVRNWDRQEVVIPNKELITSRIVNWTLSDQLNRLVVQVGVAYGTDTTKVTELLFKVCYQMENILDDPAPLITFDQFGDSTLNFTIRTYLANIDHRLETLHQLHTTIHQEFNQAGIEIAFPQLDLHVRSKPAELTTENNKD